MAKHRIAVIPGDGIGKEVVPEGLRVLEAASKKYGFELRLDQFDFSSCDYYAKHGKMLPDDWKAQIGSTAPDSTPMANARFFVVPCPAMGIEITAPSGIFWSAIPIASAKADAADIP